MNLLIVDDDEVLRSLLATELTRFGHHVAAAATAGEGLRLVGETEPDVVLLDLSLPDQSGLEVLKQLRAERPMLEVVVLTAHGTIDSAIAATKLGAYDFLQKPAPLAAGELLHPELPEQGLPDRLTRKEGHLRGGFHPLRPHERREGPRPHRRAVPGALHAGLPDREEMG